VSAAGAQFSQPWSPPPHPAELATFGSEYAQFVTHSGAASRLKWERATFTTGLVI